MRSLTVVTIFLAFTLVSLSEIPFPQPSYSLSPGRIDNPTLHDEIPTRYFPLFQGMPFVTFPLVGLGILALKIRRELEYELERGRQTEA